VFDSPWALSVARLGCLRGIDPLSAVGLCAEIGDWGPFPRPGHLMSYLGLVPSEHSSGRSRRQGSIRRPAPATAAGCWSRRPGTTAARRAPVPCSSAAKPASPPRPRDLLASPTGLHRTWQRLDRGRAKRRTIVAIAVARELAGFCWAAANAD